MEILYSGCNECNSACDCDNETYDGQECGAYGGCSCESYYDTPTCAGYDQ